MWSFFKNKVSAFQSNYREYIKGIKLATHTDGSLNYDGCEKDIELLHNVGVAGLFVTPPPKVRHDVTDIHWPPTIAFLLECLISSHFPISV